MFIQIGNKLIRASKIKVIDLIGGAKCLAPDTIFVNYTTKNDGDENDGNYDAIEFNSAEEATQAFNKAKAELNGGLGKEKIYGTCRKCACDMCTVINRKIMDAGKIISTAFVR